MSKATRILLLIVFALVIRLAPTPLHAAPAQQVDESRNFDAVIVDRGYSSGSRGARDCRTNELIDLSDREYRLNVQVGRTYHFENAWIFEGNPGQLFFLLVESRGFRYWEIAGCPLSAPPQVNFSVDQNNLMLGQCATLRWDVDNVRAVYLDGQGVTGHNSRSVCPSSTTTYTLRAVTNSGDINRTVTVYVQIPPPLVEFQADRSSIPKGECAYLKWAVAYVQSISLDGRSKFDNPGTEKVCPTTTTTYTLQVGSSSGDVIRQITVTVIQPQSYDARQIRFSVKDGTFTYLKIVGKNQYAVVTTLERSFDREQYYFDTTDYWWRETIVLTFNVANRGMRSCVIDYLRETTAGNLTPVMYTEGEECSGDAGSGGSSRLLVQALYEALYSEDNALKVYGAMTGVYDRWACTYAMVQGVKGIGGVIKLGKECGGIVLEAVNEVLKKFNKTAEMDTGSSNTAVPSTSMTVSSSSTTPTAIPEVAPSFAFVDLRWEPASPHWGNDVVFYAKFNNTFTEQKYLSWRIEICTPDCPNWTKLMFQTDPKQEFVPPGGMSEVVSKPWPLRGKGGTQTYPVRFVHIAPDGTRTGEKIYYVTVTP